MPVLKKSALITVVLALILVFIAGSQACTTPKVNLPVVLFSDYGSGDYRVSQLKGIILDHNANVRLIDASHGVPAFDIPTGAFMLYLAAKEFPGNVVFVVVVNPYTSPEPRYLVLTTNKEQTFVLPDNGLLTYVINYMGIKSLYSIDNGQLFDQPLLELSAERIEGTIGGLISSGYRLQDVGSSITDPVILDIQEPLAVNGQLLGTVVFIDNFGNCVTNISQDTAAQFGLVPGDTIQIQVQPSPIMAKYGTIYSDVPEGKEVAFLNSDLGVVQLSINLGNFAEKYLIRAGSKIAIQKTEL